MMVYAHKRYRKYRIKMIVKTNIERDAGKENLQTLERGQAMVHLNCNARLAKFIANIYVWSYLFQSGSLSLGNGWRTYLLRRGDIEPRTLHVICRIKIKSLSQYLLFSYLNPVKMFLRSTMICILQRSSQFENLSSTLTKIVVKHIFKEFFHDVFKVAHGLQN